MTKLYYFSVLFSERFLHNVYDIISDNFRLGYVQASGGQAVMCYFLVPWSNIVCLFTHAYFLNRIASFEKLKNNNNKYENTISPEDG